MGKSEILRDHALKHVWAEPVQDRQWVIKPNRLSPDLGFFGMGKLMWEAVELPNYSNPTDKTSYHLYSLGKLPAWVMALDEMVVGKWYRFSDINNTNNTVIDIWADNGAYIPRALYYLQQHPSGALLVAIARLPIDLGSETRIDPYGTPIETGYSLDKHGVTVRFYTNALLSSPSWRETAVDPMVSIRTLSRSVSNAGDFTSFMNQVASIEGQYKGKGIGIFYLDGFLTTRPNGWRSEYAGKYLSYHFDETVREIQSYPIRQVPSFRSTLDTRRDKYLLVGPVTHSRIDYVDDLDFYLVGKDPATGLDRGVFLDRLLKRNIRQVTHNAWSVDSNLIRTLANLHSHLNDIQLLELRVVVRDGGMTHGIPFTNNRVEDLYHLTRAEVIEAMTSTNSTVPFWKAAALESSAYMQVMQANEKEITLDKVAEAYGYNASISAVQRTIYPVINNSVQLDEAFGISTNLFKPSPDLLISRRAYFWYDRNGKLLGYTRDTGVNLKITVPEQYQNQADTVEVFIGQLVDDGYSNGTVRDTETIPDPYFGFFGYRNYVCSIVGGRPDNKWVDVTEQAYASFYPAVGTTPPYIKWNYSLLAQAGLFPLTKFANTINVRSFVFNRSAYTGAFVIPLTTTQNGALQSFGPEPACVDVWMDGEALVEGIDYYFGENSTVGVVKQCMNEQASITIRCYGYCDPKTNRRLGNLDTGYVQNGVISHNGIFNVNHDRPVRVTVGGQVLRRDQVVFAEDQIGDESSTRLHLDGKPYAVETYQPLVEPYTNKITALWQREGYEIDQYVSDYLTARLEEPKVVDPYISVEKWELYSPIISWLAFQMSINAITDTSLAVVDTDKKLTTLFDPIVEQFREFDPALQNYDPNYNIIHPHAFNRELTVTSLQYATLERINYLYLRGVVDLSHLIRII